jgi:hypothetical protein
MPETADLFNPKASFQNPCLSVAVRGLFFARETGFLECQRPACRAEEKFSEISRH